MNKETLLYFFIDPGDSNLKLPDIRHPVFHFLTCHRQVRLYR